MALPESALIELLAAPKPHPGLVEFFGAALHAELAKLARAARRRRGPPGRRVYVLPGIMGSQLGLVRGEGRPNDVLWLDPIDIAFGRLKELRLHEGSRVVALGAMNYSYLKLTLSLRKAGYDAVLLDYDWRRDIAALGTRLAQRLAADARDNVAIVAHSMGGLVARAALTHTAGRQVSQLITLGTPNAGSLAAVQALRGTYSVVRKIAMLDLRHDAEYLARQVFSTFPGLHELLPANRSVSDLDLFDAASWPAGPGPDETLLLAASGLEQRMAPADARFHVVVGCNRTTATGVALKDGDFEYEYSLQGDGTVPVELARLPGARHSYVECGHSDLPLADRVIAGTLDLLSTGATQRFAAAPPVRRGALTRVRDAELRQQYQGKVDWPHMTPEQRRLFLDTLNEPPRGRAHRRPQRPTARPLQIRVVVDDVANARTAATAVAVLRGVPAGGAAADIDARLGGVIADWLQHRVVSGDAGNVTPIPRALQRPKGGHAGRRTRTAYLLVGLGRFDRLSLDVIEHAAENLARFAEQPQYRSLATVAWGAHSGIAPEDSFAAQLRGLLRARTAGQAALTRVDLHVLSRAAAQRVQRRLADFVKARPAGTLRLTPLAPAVGRATTRSRRVPGTAHLIIAAETGTGARETWRASLLTGGTSAAIFSQSQELATRELEALDRQFLAEALTAARVKTLGEKLARLALHPALARALRAARGQAISVVHDAASSRVPWETLNLRGWCPALDHGLSRRYATADLVPARFDPRQREQRELSVLIIANPTLDLPGADAERARIADMLRGLRRVRLTEVSGEAATQARVSAEFESGRYDVIHYAGHAFFDPRRPGESGLVLADGEFTGAHLAALGRLPPLLVFNACESARMRRSAPRGAKADDAARKARRKTQRSQGMRTNLTLAETLLRAGVAHYIGTHWPVTDEAATAFAGTFYRELLRGSIGAALVKARRAVLARRSPDWADYVHYGDAEFRLKLR
jgi:CHAT domain-containing protein